MASAPGYSRVARVGHWIGEKGAHLVGCRQRAERIQHDAPQEFGVAAQRRGDDVETAQLDEYLAVDVIVFGYDRIDKLLSHRHRPQDAGSQQLDTIGGRHPRIPRTRPMDLTLLVRS